MKFQIGKGGVSEGTVMSLTNAFKTHQVVRISVLSNYAPTKDKVRELAEALCKRLSGKYRYNVIGFTIVLHKQREGTRQKRKAL